MMKDTKKEITSAVKSSVSPIREDLETLKDDMRTLREDAAVLSRDLQVEGKKQYDMAGERAKEALGQAKVQGKQQYAELMSFVRTNPGQSVTIAFVGGMLASLLLGRRG